MQKIKFYVNGKRGKKAPVNDKNEAFQYKFIIINEWRWTFFLCSVSLVHLRHGAEGPPIWYQIIPVFVS